MPKVKITVVFGSEATEYSCEHGVKKTVAKLKKGTIEGEYNVYELDSEHDADMLIQALCDADGWNGADYIQETVK